VNNNRSNWSTPKRPNSSDSSSSPPAVGFVSRSNYRSNLNVELQSKFQKLNEKERNSYSSGGSTPLRMDEILQKQDIPTSDIKRVRALFEGVSVSSSSRKSSLGEDLPCLGGAWSKLYSKSSTDSIAPTSSAETSKRLMHFGGCTNEYNNKQNHEAVSKILKSAYNRFNLDGEGVDFAEILINEKVVIEDSDSLHYLRNR
jgi:hypothetical protein